MLSQTSSAAKVGIVTFAFAIPFVLFALLAGALSIGRSQARDGRRGL